MAWTCLDALVRRISFSKSDPVTAAIVLAGKFPYSIQTKGRLADALRRPLCRLDGTCKRPVVAHLRDRGGRAERGYAQPSKRRCRFFGARRDAYGLNETFRNFNDYFPLASEHVPVFWGKFQLKVEKPVSHVG